MIDFLVRFHDKIHRRAFSQIRKLANRAKQNVSAIWIWQIKFQCKYHFTYGSVLPVDHEARAVASLAEQKVVDPVVKVIKLFFLHHSNQLLE